MQIFTSYYANRELQKGDYTLVGISIGKNRWAKVDAYLTDIAPTWDMVKMTNQNVYREAYFERLNTLDVNNLKKILEHLSSNKPIVLLCYENLQKPGQWCHRTMFAEWWQTKTGEVIEELPTKQIKTKSLLNLM
jgi:uncharacterized protein YeaO (DUF488 family)